MSWEYLASRVLEVDVMICPLPACPTALPPGGVMCPAHWHLVPKLHQNRVLDALIAGEGLADAVKLASDSVQVLEALRKRVKA